MSGARPLAVFDLDGTLADVRHRLPLLARRPRDWDGFFAAAPDDPPLATGVALARESARDCDVVYVTGRPERCRADTVAWLARHGLPEGELSMRRDGDSGPARLTKVQLLRRLALGRVVAVVVDDDEQVCRAYEREGWRVLRTGGQDGGQDDAALLEQAQEEGGA